MLAELSCIAVSELLCKSIPDSETLNASVDICSSSGDSGESGSGGLSLKTTDEDELSVALPLVPRVEVSEMNFVYILGYKNYKNCL